MAPTSPPPEFGDAEPEDAYDAGDEVGDKLANLDRRLDLVEADSDTPRNVARLLMAEDDLEHLRIPRGTAHHDRFVVLRRRIEELKR
jgi:hypothetical protein